MDYLLFPLSFVGLLNASFLHWQYKRFMKTGQKMYCLMKEDCAAVIGSIYGTTFGVKNEIIGIIFYLSLIAYSLFGGPRLVFGAIIIFSALFSLYLLFLQSFILKKFCSWCLVAIFINFLLLLTF